MPNAKRLILNKHHLTPNRQTSAQTTPTKPHTPGGGGNTGGGGVGGGSASISQRLSASYVEKEQRLDTSELFQNQIPSYQPSPIVASTENNEASRRVSWLQSNALEKARQMNTNRLSEQQPLDNTIAELNKETLTGTSTTSKGSGGGRNKDKNIEQHSPTTARYMAQTSSDSILSNRTLDESQHELNLTNMEPHPTGIVLRRPGYFTIPKLEDLVSYLSEDGTCVVPNFTIGRHGYGNVFFNEPIDVADLNLDQIVHFRHKEVIIYPDDDNKPPIGQGLNRKAQITLDQVWPHDKTNHEPIKDPERLEVMDYEGKLRRVCDKHDTRFIDYRPESGSWVFKVDHFSKYGLSDSDEEDDDPVPDMKKAKMGVLPKKKGVDGGKVVAAGKEGGVGGGAIKKVITSGGTTIASARTVENLLEMNENDGDDDEDGHDDADDDDSAFIDLINKSRGGGGARGGYRSHRATSPSSELAMEIGQDSHKLQLMKASFFADDDYSGKSTPFDGLSGRSTPDQIVPNKPIFNKQQFDKYANGTTASISMLNKQALLSAAVAASSGGAGVDKIPIQIGGGDKTESIKSGLIKPIQQSNDDALESDSFVFNQMTDPTYHSVIVKPKIALVKIPGTVIPMVDSILNEMGNCTLADLSFMNGRRFKVGWGHKNKLFVLNSLNNTQMLNKSSKNMDELAEFMAGRSRDDSSPLILQELQINSSKHIDYFDESIESHLRIQLDNSSRRLDSDCECAYLTVNEGTTAIEEHFEQSKNLIGLGKKEEYDHSVWSLCRLLWGEREELEGQELNSHTTIMCRRELFSNWLEMVVDDGSETDDGDDGNNTKLSYLTQLLELLMCHKVIEACELAFTNNDMNLSLLLAQISGGPAIRQLMQHQLSSWQEVEADKYIAVERIKALMLVAGIPILASSSHGNLNVFDHLDWIKSLSLYIWYLCSPTASITDALLMFEKAFESDEFYASPPTPPYTDRYQPETNKQLFDLRYHLLKLYSKRSHPLEALLNPATHTADPMDFRLSWLLLQNLEAIGYRHCSDLSECQLHVSFASQLETQNMWHWSIFVLLHIKNRERRELAVQQLLYRYIEVSSSGNDDYLEKEKFIIELGVPEKWIYWAKAVRAGASSDYHEQAKYLLKGKQWTLAHEVIMTNIAPDAIVNENITYIKMLLNSFEDQRQISNWSTQGQMILDYIDISEKVRR